MIAQYDGPDEQEFERIAKASIARLPLQFREKLRGVVLKIVEFASAEQLDSVGLENRWQLSGLYQGRPIPRQSIWSSGDMPPVISLFRQPLLAEIHQTGVGLEELIHHVVIHEAGHHFGFSDEEMHALEREARAEAAKR